MGGVAVQARILADHLSGLGHRVTVAYYATYRGYPELTGSLRRLSRGRGPKLRVSRGWSGQVMVAAGSWLPELEATY